MDLKDIEDFKAKAEKRYSDSIVVDLRIDTTKNYIEHLLLECIEYNDNYSKIVAEAHSFLNTLANAKEIARKNIEVERDIFYRALDDIRQMKHSINK